MYMWYRAIRVLVPFFVMVGLLPSHVIIMLSILMLPNIIIAVKMQKVMSFMQAWIAQLVAHQLGATVVMGSNPGKGEDFSKKI